MQISKIKVAIFSLIIIGAIALTSFKKETDRNNAPGNKYIIVYAESVGSLEEKVNNFLALGYKPIGGVTIENQPVKSTTLYFQAVLQN